MIRADEINASNSGWNQHRTMSPFLWLSAQRIDQKPPMIGVPSFGAVSIGCHSITSPHKLDCAVA